MHGGPHGPRDYDEYEPFEQYLASNGVAVLKVNFRGSGGYGKNYEESGYKEWGGKIMDDIAHATTDIQANLIYRVKIPVLVALVSVVMQP